MSPFHALPITSSELQAKQRRVLQPARHDARLDVEVLYTENDGRYVATRDCYLGEGLSLTEALHELANQLDAAGKYDADKFDINELVKARRTKKCVYCGGRIFFAKSINDKWMPIDGDSVPAAMVGNVNGYVLSEQAGEVRAAKVSKRHQGQVWVAHQGVCGSSAEPESAFLKLRWETNRGVTAQTTAEAIQDLQKIAVQLHQPNPKAV